MASGGRVLEHLLYRETGGQVDLGCQETVFPGERVIPLRTQTSGRNPSLFQVTWSVASCEFLGMVGVGTVRNTLILTRTMVLTAGGVEPRSPKSAGCPVARFPSPRPLTMRPESACSPSSEPQSQTKRHSSSCTISWKARSNDESAPHWRMVARRLRKRAKS